MNRIKELNEKRGAKLKEAASIIETATTEKRELTSEEATKVNVFHDEAETIAVSIAAEARSLAAMSASMPQLSRQEERDVQSFNFAKVLTHLHRSAKGGITSLDGIEAEMIQEGEREARSAGVQAGGILLPRMLVRRENRDMTATGTTSTTGDQGGMTVATNKAGLLDDFFNASILRGLGSTVLEGLQGNLDIPRIIAGTDPAKKAENGAADEVSPTTAMLSLSPKRLPAYIDISEQLLNQSSSAIEAILRGHLTTQMGAIREKSFFHGGGTNEPVGIAGTSGIGSVAGGTNGAAPVWTHLTQLEEKVDAQNALLGSLAYGVEARVVNEAQFDPTPGTKDTRPNVSRGMVRDIVESARITNNNWYLFADPNEVPTIEVAFLNGVNAPFLDSEEGFTSDGVRMKVRLDYGIRAVDWRGAIRNNGA